MAHIVYIHPSPHYIYCIAAQTEIIRRVRRVPFRGEASNSGQSTISDTAGCEHNDLLLAINTDTGYCYARCLRCLFTGPERRSAEAARLALRGQASPVQL